MIAAYTEGDEPVPGFRLVKLLSYENFGSVWKATGPGGMEACVKIVSLVNKKQLKEFSALRLVKHVRHPNLVPILAFWLKDRQGNFIDERLVEDSDPLATHPVDLIMVMGLGDKSLFHRLKECQAEGLTGIPPRELLSYMDDVAAALDHLNRPIHDLGAGPSAIQHCDIKPQNVLIVGSAAQICDLGGARMVDDLRATSAVGSAAYMAPEFITEGHPSRSTDQYSLAICYVELRTGALPLNAKSAAAAYFTHIRGALDLSQLPPAERAVVARATTVRADNRFPTCTALVRALRQACGLAEESEPAEAESAKANINLLAERLHQPIRTPAEVGVEEDEVDAEASDAPSQPEVSPVEAKGPDLASPLRPPSDESVDLAATLPRRDDTTFAENLSIISNQHAILPASADELARTAVVEVRVVPGAQPAPEEEEEEDWPSASAGPRKSEVIEAPATRAEEPDPWSDPKMQPAPIAADAAAPEPESEESSPPPAPAEAIASRTRWRLSYVLAVASAACLGLCISWLARSTASSAQAVAITEPEPEEPAEPGRWAVPAPRKPVDPPVVAEKPVPPPPVMREKPAPPSVVPAPPRIVETVMRSPIVHGPFVLAGTSQTFDRLAAAVAAATSGETIEVQGDGPFAIEALNLHGKELTIKATPGSRPCFETCGGGCPCWQGLFTSDRALVLEGLTLRCHPELGTASSSGVAQLVATNQASLRLARCRLELPYGSAAVLCRNPGTLELLDCTLLAGTLAVCVEVGDGQCCEIRLTGTTIQVREPGGAALSIWAPEVRRCSPVALHLERNVISAGRIAALKALLDGIDVDARDNWFTFHEAMLSYVGFPGRDGWRRATRWREQANTYQGSGDWLRIDGRLGDVHDPARWQKLWNGAAEQARLPRRP